MARTDVLDPREKRFVELYVETNNGTRSALAAGYGRNYNNAAVYANSLLKKPKIKNAVDKRNAEVMLELDFTPDRIIAEIAKIAGANAADFMTVDDDGKPNLDLSTIKRRHTAAIASIEDAGAKTGAKIKMYDKLKALTELAKLARMYPAEQTEISGPNGGPIQSANLVMHKIDIASLEPDDREKLRGVLLALKAKSEAPNDEA